MQVINQNLQTKLARIKKVFDTNKVLLAKTDTNAIAKYYNVNKLYYSLFHNRKDFIHMGISREGKYQEADLLEHLRLLENYLIKYKSKTVLELGAGKGANSIYLARKYPNIQFHAIDLPNGQLDTAIRKSTKIPNFHPKEGDYHNLNTYPDDCFDIIFMIEALCHSNDKKRVFQEARRVLKKGGIFAIFDGYLGKPRSALTKDELLASQLTEKGMLIKYFEYYPQVKENLLKEGFKEIYEEDVSGLILPTLRRFEKKANVLFSMPNQLARVILFLFPHEFTNNALSGYLMPTLIEIGVAKYIILIAEK